ncbi:hypothetical protein Tco_1113315 [Tanacetum coccineum]|uniref:Uncharacterized protein n=1 Tax=Tanacetum coccineum TaxID=301880 RepID=A0ABQ5IRX0_9ASTR
MSNAESTVNEYLTKVRDDSGPGIVRPLFEENSKFEFWGQCIGELKDNVFLGNNEKNPPRTHLEYHIYYQPIPISWSVKRPGNAHGISFYAKRKSQTVDKPVVNRIHYNLGPPEKRFSKHIPPAFPNYQTNQGYQKF